MSSAGAAIACGLEAAGAASCLRLLNLTINRLGDAAAAALGRALAAQGPAGALLELRVGWNRFGPEAARHLAEGLRVNSTLEIIGLGGHEDIGPEGAAAIVRGIASNGGTASAVRSLSLEGCNLGDAGVVAMMEAGLERNITLTKLNIRDNVFGEGGFLALGRWGEARCIIR
jgi:Ran GTPase-activating protein (RanGAP) involved in mRNA processing and transport